MKTPAKPPKKAKIADITPRSNNYQVSRSLPDLRDGTLQTPPPIKPQPKRRGFGWKKFFKRTFLLLFIMVLLTSGWLGYKAYRNSNKLGTSLWSLFDNSKLKGEDRGRINILLAGNSADDPGHDGADLTDSIMLISINPNNKTAFLMYPARPVC
jgi:hypothetical protein